MPNPDEFTSVNTPAPGQPAQPWGSAPSWTYGDYWNYANGAVPPYAAATPNTYPYGYPYACANGACSSAVPYPGIDYRGVNGINEPKKDCAYIFPDSAYVEIAALCQDKAYSSGYKTFFTQPHDTVFSKFSAPECMTVNDMIKKLGGKPKKSYLCEAIEAGIGVGWNGTQPSWIRGQVVFGGGSDGKKTLSELGWTQVRNTNLPAVRLILGKGKKKA